MNEIRFEKHDKAMLMHARIQTAVLLCLFVLLAGAVIFLAVQITGVKQWTDEIGVNAEELKQTVDSLHSTADALSGIDINQINDTVGVLKDAAEKLGDIDITSLNNAVTELKGAAGTLQDLDIDALNRLVSSLDTVAARLQNAVNSITGIFSR